MSKQMSNFHIGNTGQGRERVDIENGNYMLFTSSFKQRFPFLIHSGNGQRTNYRPTKSVSI